MYGRPTVIINANFDRTISKNRRLYNYAKLNVLFPKLKCSVTQVIKFQTDSIQIKTFRKRKMGKYKTFD